MAKFQPGKSGNPTGRRPGVPNKLTTLRRGLEKALPDVLAALVEQAQAGDVQAIKIVLDRVLPALRPVDAPIKLPLGGDLTDDGRATLAALGAGQIGADQAVKILQGLGALARITETDELLRRVEALEELQHGNSNKP
jgi:hypothetical protein